MNIKPQLFQQLYIEVKYLELSLESRDWIDNLLKKSQTSQVINKILIRWREGDMQQKYIYLYLSDDKWNLSFINRLKFWVLTILMMYAGVTIPVPLKKDFDLFRKALTLASIFLAEKSWYKEITDNTTKE